MLRCGRSLHCLYWMPFYGKLFSAFFYTLLSKRYIHRSWFAEDQHVIQCTEGKLRPAEVSKWFIMKTDKKPDHYYRICLMFLECRSVGFNKF
jgi:hypothetical protein